MIITILGLGRMGSAIARNLIELGHEVTLYNRTRAQALALAAGQALPGAHRKAVQVADTVADAVREARVAITVVAGDEAEEALAFGPGGLLEHLPEGAIHLCMSTLSPAVSRRLAEAHQTAGQGYVAAPMLGNPSAAKARRLWLLAAGPEIQVNRCLVLLESLSHSITRVGPRADLAHALKLGADALSVAMVETLAEVLAYGNKLGFPSAEYLRILNPGLFKSPLLDAFGGLMAREDYAPTNQTLDLAARDLEQLVQTARDLDLAMPMTGPLLQQVRAAQARGLGDRDLVALSLVHRQDAGLTPSADREWPTMALKRSSPARDRRVHGRDRRTPATERPGPPEAPEQPASGTELPALELEPAPPPPAPEAPSEPDLEPDPGQAEVSPYPARDADGPVMLDLWQTTHFEHNGNTVWAWVEGRRHATFWRDLDEVERTLGQVLLVRIQSRILLSPQAILELQPLFGGRARISVAGGVSLTASRDAVRRLRFLLGY